MPFVAWYRRDDEEEPWGLEHLFEVDSQGNPITVFRTLESYPDALVQLIWKNANQMASVDPDFHKLEIVDPIDLPLLEMQLRLHQEEERRVHMLQKKGLHFVLNAGGRFHEEEVVEVGYGRIVNIVKPFELSEVVILGVFPDPRPLWQTLYPFNYPTGRPIETSQGLVPGAHYLMKTGKGSILSDAGKEVLQELRTVREDWIHVVDDELDAPDLPPPSFRRR